MTSCKKKFLIHTLWFQFYVVVVHGAITDLKFNGDSYIHYSFPKVDGKAQNSNAEGISLVFKTTKAGGTPLFFAHSTETSSFQLITLEEESIKMQYKFVRHAGEISATQTINYAGRFADGKWHTLIVRRMSSPEVLSVTVDDGNTFMKSLEGYMRKFRKLDEIYVGKVHQSHGFVGLMRRAHFQPSFINYPIELITLAIERSPEIIAANFSKREETTNEDLPVNIKVIPQILHAKYEDPEISLICSVHNVSDSTVIEWKKNGTSVFKQGSLSSNYSVTLSEKPDEHQVNSTLSIKSLVMEHDGMYECAVTFADNKTFSVFTTLVVHGEPDPPENLQLRETESGMIQVSWRKPENYSTLSIKGYVIYYQECYSVTECEEEEKSLFIKNDQESEDQSTTLSKAPPNTEYNVQVTAINTRGESRRSSLVRLKTKESYPYEPPEIESVSLPDYGKVSVVWKPPNSRSVNSDTYWYILEYMSTAGDITRVKLSSEVKTYDITHLNAWTEYIIQMRTVNKLGSSPASIKRFTTKEAAPSSSPTISEFFFTSNTSIRIHWKMPEADSWNSDKLDAALIHYIEEGDSNRKGISRFDLDNGPPPKYLYLNGLKPSTDYRLYLTVVNIAGESPMSQSVKFRTRKIAPAEAPVIINVTSPESKTLKVYWKDLPSYYAVESYNIHYRIRDQNRDSEAVKTAPASLQSPMIRLENLLEYTEYAITMSASNNLGDGPRSAVVYKRTAEGVPRVAPNIIWVEPVGSTQLEIEWEPIDVTNISGKLLGYRIAYGISEKPTNQFVYVNDSLETRALIKGLLPDSTYYVKLAGFTSAGVGDGSTEVRVQTNPEVSTAPRDFRAIAVSPTTIRLSWRKPSKPNGRLKYYILSCSERKDHFFPYNKDKVESQKITDTKKSKYIIFDFTRRKVFTKYYFSLRAYTGVEGKEAWTSTKTLQGASSQPRNISLQYLSSERIKITWLPPKYANGIITEYEVLLFEHKTNKEIQKMVKPAAGRMSVVIEDLLALEFYTVSICAVTTVDGEPFVLKLETLPETNTNVDRLQSVKVSQEKGSFIQLHILFIALIVLVVIICVLITVCITCYFCNRNKKGVERDDNHNIRIDMQRSRQEEIELEYRMDESIHSEEDEEFRRFYDEIPQTEPEEDEKSSLGEAISPGTQTWDSGFPNGTGRESGSSKQSESSLEVEKFLSSEEMRKSYGHVGKCITAI